ncbi:translation initiation factor 2 [Streptomyces sp. NPDC095613]|uniref:translation initiation factor 2 n=1 Tax=Streptomyces sp. NPDC095613 TaxID=3155540 RepID=UPI003316FB64
MAAGSGQRAAGSGQRAAELSVLYAVRSATALNRLLDTLPVFSGDDRVRPVFTLVPGSDFGTDALAALDEAGARTIPWSTAVRTEHALVVAASPNGPLRELRGPLVLLPHGAGFNKRLPDASDDDSASGLHPRQLLRDGEPLAALHALAHPGQLTRLARGSRAVAARARVVGDPTLDRMLASRGLRERYRDALRTGGRRLVAVVSTWGPESLMVRRSGLPARLTAELPYDAYQVALVVHPNVHSELGAFELRRRLRPALDAGLLLPRPYEEWAAVLTAADCVLTDHGSAALYAAALDRPLMGCYEGGTELVPASPMAGLLAHVPRLTADAALDRQVDAAVAAYRPGDIRAVADAAFAERDRALERLRAHCYRLLGLEPPAGAVTARPLPLPRVTGERPTALAALTEVRGTTVSVARYPLSRGPHGGHTVAEYGLSSVNETRAAGLLVRRARPATGPEPHARDAVWTAGGWTTYALEEYPGCRTAAAVLTHDHGVLRRAEHRDALSVRLAAHASPEPWVRPDPAAVLSCVHAWLEANESPALPVSLDCLVGGRRTTVLLTYATETETHAEL